jgi:hypothetical protein
VSDEIGERLAALMERIEAQIARAGSALDAAIAEQDSRFAAFDRRLTTIEAELAIRRGAVSAWGGESEPMTITHETNDQRRT